MSRFEKYNNSGELIQFLNKIKKECKPYLKLLKGRTPLYRGMKSKKEVMGIKDVRQKRFPLGTPIDVFPAINNWLESNGHVRRDRAVMANSDKVRIRLFGQTYVIFPIGSFNYTWVRSRDWNDNDPSTEWDIMDVQYYLMNKNIPRGFEGIEKRAKNLLETHITTNKGFDIAYNKNYEVWFDCKKYYYMNEYKYSINQDFIEKELK